MRSVPRPTVLALLGCASPRAELRPDSVRAEIARQLEHGERQFGCEILIRGAAERLAPILMTALCAELALRCPEASPDRSSSIRWPS